jgi:hypothetical protein
MKAPFNSMLAVIGGCIIALTAAAGSAIAGCPCAPPPPCCSPPTPPTPPQFPCCAPPANNVIIPGVEVVVAPTVIVNAQAQVQANVLAGAQAGAAVFVGGGGGGGMIAPGPVGLIQNLNVGAGTESAAYESTRTKIKKVIIEVVCIDDKQVPHPGSQVTPDKDIEDSYDGELYRCIAGTHMRATFAEWNEGLSFDHGWTLDCNKNEALYHAPGGKVECRVQKPARDCNERSLLRRFGAGIKIFTMVTIEKFTAYREQTTQTSTASSMSIDGGVGGVVY